ncbi:tripartite tricarboxylate transporter substrate binding protein [Advenella mimigardefordensis]|uniref:Putative Bug-like extracytoplasmic solute binding receptor, TTT family n=1 Tax=Advenella mimigardefordensis (strain DSM 17166 / LMG 22922 / DPN7) TaxID=1247726 RepID=W0PEB0_ADVMD|nr:tripartite tricarboxylate transporter substrate binding protein [Advenella mimigardefordensis]AHG63817.1 putative Bug-like extracytoplasmic solute binding receptor, TTT family [Advenella mimigardefordensis DPN7]
MRKYTLLGKIVGATAIAILSAHAAVVSAASYPDKNVTLIVQSSAGGGSDIFARTVANIIQKKNLLASRLLIENRPGGGGAIAYNFIAKKKKNPYYLGTLATSFFTAPLLGRTTTGYDDFKLVAAIAADPFVLVANKDSSIKSIEDIKKMDSIRVGNTGAVTDPAMLGAQLAKQLGVELRAVPFNGDGEVTTALLGNHIDLQFGNASEVMSQVQAGRVIPLGVTSASRLAVLPNVPTLKEQGVDIELQLYRGFMMPADVADDVVSFWENVFRTVAESEEWKEEYLTRNNSFPVFLDSRQFEAELPKIVNQYKEFISQSKK